VPGEVGALRGATVNAVHAHVVSPEWAVRVVSPLHDVLSASERREILIDNPDSYLHVTSDPLALPRQQPGEVRDDSVQSQALQRLLALGAYPPTAQPALFVYRLTDRGRDHTGVIAGVGVESFRDGRVLGHERVQADRVAGLIRHYQRVSMRSELVTLFHPVDPLVADATARVMKQPALLHFTDVSGVAQSVWQAAPTDAAILRQALGGQPLYVADGHHRVAAATRLWEMSSEQRPDDVLCAIYPQDEIDLHAFHRRVRGPVSLPALIEGLATHFEVMALDGSNREAVTDLEAGCIGLYAAGGWWRLRQRRPRPLPGVAGLDVTRLDQLVLRPLLAIGPGDSRLEFLPDLRDLDAVTKECDADAGVLFALAAPRIEDVVSVAERHEVMSAKTTYVQPKPRTGIFLS
jgi:uncharacterized protein (DUF1015 family)